MEIFQYNAQDGEYKYRFIEFPDEYFWDISDKEYSDEEYSYPDEEYSYSSFEDEELPDEDRWEPPAADEDSSYEEYWSDKYWDLPDLEYQYPHGKEYRHPSDVEHWNPPDKEYRNEKRDRDYRNLSDKKKCWDEEYWNQADEQY